MIRRLLVAAALATVAGAAAILGLSAAARAYGRPGAAVLLALAAVWLSLAIAPLIRHHLRRPRP